MMVKSEFISGVISLTLITEMMVKMGFVFVCFCFLFRDYLNFFRIR